MGIGHEIYFFGCNMTNGHHLYGPGGGWFDPRQANLPFRYEHLDGGILLPRPERVGEGSLVYLFDWTVLSWWGSPFDTRGAVCNAILLKGKWGDDYVWEQFRLKFEALAARLSLPKIVWSFYQ